MEEDRGSIVDVDDDVAEGSSAVSGVVTAGSVATGIIREQ